jgi:hypothetical protein
LALQKAGKTAVIKATNAEVYDFGEQVGDAGCGALVGDMAVLGAMGIVRFRRQKREWREADEKRIAEQMQRERELDAKWETIHGSTHWSGGKNPLFYGEDANP